MAERRTHHIQQQTITVLPSTRASYTRLQPSVSSRKLKMKTHNMDSAASRQQYHHFVPRFILRNFLGLNQPPSGPASSKEKKRQRRDGWVNHLILETTEVEQRPLSKLFGLGDMYKADSDGEQDTYHLEKALSRLEGEAAELLNRAKAKFENEHGVLTLTRHERNQLRKFFFLMKYRNSRQYYRYNHTSINAYKEVDKEQLKEYMTEKGFTRPRDVWLANLDAFITVELDVDFKWLDFLRGKAFPDDVNLFLEHVQMKSMHFCSCKLSRKEFVVPENAYSIFEGPVSSTGIKDSNGVDLETWIEYHNFAPVSPTLMVIFRSNLLDPDAPKQSKELLEMCKKQHNSPDEAGSMLMDLPLQRCVPSYQMMSNNRPVAKANWTGYGPNDKFDFKCSLLRPAHVDDINVIMLENAYLGSLIAFHDSRLFVDAVRSYLTTMREGFKTITGGPDQPRKAYILSLIRFLQQQTG